MSRSFLSARRILQITGVRRERKYGSFTRSFDISDIDQAKINASYDNGILSVELPKQVEVVPAPTKIDIK